MFVFNDSATTEIYTRSIVGSVRCVQETGPIGSIEKIPCSPGYFQASTQQSTCTPCTSGHYCMYSSTAGTIAETDCPKGACCSGTTLDRPTSCAIGTYQNALAQTTCTTCTAGHYCNVRGQETEINCPGGYYCPCLLYTSPSPRDLSTSRMPSSA
eukprot:TRINITY_DN60867_c0_g1_i1.p3 TRINITY_DN60867_c0_g1~~TRINITY_DN60867_c0_g1_i1.p3  ORF type:complete len:155 (-),score=14.37 TRINITY_DN60867_c0_g1_i1:43-507(-)